METILCLFGGQSTEYEVSCRSFGSVIKNIDRNRFNIIKVGINKSGEWNIYTGSDEKIKDLSWSSDEKHLYSCVIAPKSAINKRASLYKFYDNQKAEIIQIDAILPIIHGANGEDGAIQGLAQLYNIPCAGSDLAGSICAFDKAITKILCENVAKQGDYISFKDYEYKNNIEIILKSIERLGLPIFVKPAKAGSSVGMTKVKAFGDELKNAINEAFKFDNKIVIEKNIIGKEIEVAILGNSDDLIISCAGEINPNADFYDYETKYINDTAEYFIPANINQNLSERVRKLAGKIYQAVGAGGFSRVDFFVNETTEEIYFNEINTIPGFTEISMFAKLFGECGISYKEVLSKIIDLAICK